MKSSFVDDDEFPLDYWCEDNNVFPEGDCPWCEGAGIYKGEPCSCIISAALLADPEAAEEAFADVECPRCAGDGEDFSEALCPCQLTPFLLFIVNADR